MEVMKFKIETNWKGNMQFDANIGGHVLTMDAATDNGGNDKGVRPKPLMIASLAGCTGMDVISILKKMRVEVEDFKIEIEADSTEEHPKHYTKMHVVYQFKGKDLDPEKLKKAVDLSQERYCGVSAAYKKAMELSYEIKIV
jgi:putative redox protein